MKEQLWKLVLALIARVFVLHDVKKVMEQLRTEMAAERAVAFTTSLATIGNVLGHDPKTHLSDWRIEGDEEYPLRRSEKWDSSEAEDPATKATTTPPAYSVGQGEPPEELRDYERVMHTQIENISHLRMTLWDKARWVGAFYMMVPDMSHPPTLGLIFQGGEAATEIFANWRKEFGAKDEQETLRVTIVKGVDRRRAGSYRIMIGSNPTLPFSRPDIKFSVMTSRIQTMEASSEDHLSKFLEAYKTVGAYKLGPAVQTSAGAPSPSNLLVSPRLGIEKKELYLREAWQIGRNDPDAAAITDDDQPIIPPDEKNPPVMELIRWKAKRRTERAGTAGVGDGKGDPHRSKEKTKVGRNDPCTCGSGKKYKKCCGTAA